MVIPSKYKPLEEQIQFTIGIADNWVPIDLSGLSKTPAAALITAIDAGSGATLVWTNYSGSDPDPGNDKKPALFVNQYLLLQGAQQVKNLWFRATNGSAVISIFFYTI